MHVYIAGGEAPAQKELAAAFGDTPVAAWELAPCLNEGLRLVLRLAALSRCEAILLPAGWRGDGAAALEKAFADRQGIPEVLYFPVTAGRGA